MRDGRARGRERIVIRDVLSDRLAISHAFASALAKLVSVDQSGIPRCQTFLKRWTRGGGGRREGERGGRQSDPVRDIALLFERNAFSCRSRLLVRDPPR